MKAISSRDNPLYKDLKQLATSAQARRKAGRSLLDGVHLCEAYLGQVGKPPFCVVSENSTANPEVAAIVQACEASRVTCITLTEPLYQAISQVEHGIGLMFVVDTPQVHAPAVLTESAVLLDGLQDPGNLGSILRSAAAAGVRHVLCSKGTVFSWSPKVLRAGMGAHFTLTIAENVDLAAVIRSSRIPVLATSSHASRRIYNMDLTKPTAWLFGHEGQGVSEELLSMATESVSIPHLGPVESLNVAASAAVCLFEQVRQRTIG